MKKTLFLLLFIYQINNLFSQSGNCITATPFCATSYNTYPASQNTAAPTGPNYGCLGSQPNPAWFYFKGTAPGSLSINMSNSANVDIDYVCWGPFTSPSSACASGLTSLPVNCSYSSNSSEVCGIPSVQVGEYYMIMITNYSNQPTNITFSVTGTASVSCVETCNTNTFYNTPLCIGGTLQLIATQHFGQGTYSWNGPNGFSSAITNPILNNVPINASGFYHLTYTQDSTCSSTDSVLVNVDTCGMLIGRVYADVNNNCSYDSTENYIPNVQIKLSQNGNFFAWAWTDAYGYYFFDVPTGNYTIELVNSPDYIVTCNNSIAHSTTVTSPSITTENFAVSCNSSDIAATGIILFGQGFFPGLTNHVHPLVGTYTPVCNQNVVSGKVVVILDSLVHYSGPYNSYPAPDTVIVKPTGDTLIWNVANINTIGNFNYFNYPFETITNTTATIGDTVCITVIVYPIQGDADTTNNSYTRCFAVGNSYDPNQKEVSPKGIGQQGFISSTTPKLEYTIDFQNTGTAAAQNIIVLDTLDSDLDISSLKIICSSHQQTTTFLPGNILKFNFSNIMLADSNHDEPHSHGYVKYSIAPNQHLSPGTQLLNTAYIYFDYNSPIVTNTTLNTIEFPLGITDISNIHLVVFPNPTNSTIDVTFEDKQSESIYMKIMNVNGQIIYQEKIKKFSGKYSKTVDLSNVSNGIYLLQIVTDKETAQKKVIKD
jgi:hypothetical protein